MRMHKRRRDVSFLLVLHCHSQEETMPNVTKKKRSSYAPVKPRIKLGVHYLFMYSFIQQILSPYLGDTVVNQMPCPMEFIV